MADRNSRLVGALMVAAGAIAFSGKAVIIKLAYRHGTDAVTLLALCGGSRRLVHDPQRLRQELFRFRHLDDGAREHVGAAAGCAVHHELHRACRNEDLRARRRERQRRHRTQDDGRVPQKFTGSRERHMYHVATELHGAHFFPISRISALVSGSPSL
jgi:hypothetical protein